MFGVRPIGMLVGLGFVGMLLLTMLWGIAAYVPLIGEKTALSEFHVPKHDMKDDVSFSFEGPLGKYDNRQLQRGFQVYKEVCSACHSLKQVAFRDLEQIGFSKAEVKAIANQWTTEVPSINPETGEAATRKATPADRFPSPYPNDTAARAANNNALPPDQSLLTKARKDGARYMYSLLTGYQAQPAALVAKYPDLKTPAGLYYNPYFPNLNIAMAPPLADNQVSYADGTPATLKQEAADVTAFLMWAAEPNLPKRHAVGWASLVYLLVLTTLAWFAYKGIWADKKPKKHADA